MADLRLEGKGRKENKRIILFVKVVKYRVFLFCKKFVFITTFLRIVALRRTRAANVLLCVSKIRRGGRLKFFAIIIICFHQ